MNEYVVIDRTTLLNKAIKINDNQLYYEDTANPASDEPIIEDNINAGTYWKLFIDDDQLGWEEVHTVQDDHIDLEDEAVESVYRLFISDGQLNWYEIAQLPFGERQLIAIRKEIVESVSVINLFNGEILKYVLSSQIIKSVVEGRCVYKIPSKSVIVFVGSYKVRNSVNTNKQVSFPINRLALKSNTYQSISKASNNNVVSTRVISVNTKSRMLS